MEKSNSLLEQRNNSFQTTATQNQSRVLALEQEKVYCYYHYYCYYYCYHYCCYYYFYCY